jgi:MFS superfamily sulfate permease-like transporter
MKKVFKYVGADASASLVVFLVALPLCLGIALGSNAPLFSGIIAGIVGGIVIGSLSGSQLSVSGPAAGLTAIVATAIGKMPVFEAFLLAVVISGIVQILLGYLKAGVLGDYVPTSVIKGMLAAIGIILILKQIPHLIGFDADYEGDETFAQHDSHNTFSGIIKAFKSITVLAVVIGVLAILIQVLWDKVLVKKSNIFQLIPAPLVVVIMGVVMVKLGALTGNGYFLKANQMVAIPMASDAKEFFSFFTFPDFQYLKLPVVWTTGITIAIVASLETLLSIEAADKLDPFHRVTPTNRELKAQGIGNLLSGLIGGLPVTSVVVRTSVNINAGGKTKLSAILHGVLLLLCVAFIPNVLNLVPLSALAGVLIYTGYKLAKPTLFKEFYSKGWDQFVPFVVTILAIILTDLLIGIIVGIAVGLFFVMRSNFRTAVFVVNSDDKYLFRLRKDISFLNKALLRSKLEQVPANAEVLIDVANADFIDKDVVEVINDFLLHAHLKGIRVEVRKSPNKATHKFINSAPMSMSV